jgi:hypothetical protein
MRKILYILALVIWVGCVDSCESENIRQCAYACKDSGSRMAKYDRAGGCVCEAKP